MPISKDFLKHLDDESDSFVKEMMPSVLNDECKIEDIFGFKLSEKKARADLMHSEVSLRSVIPLYDEILVVIPPEISDKKLFEKRFHFTPEEFAFLAEKGRVIPILNESYQKYKPQIVEPLLQPGIRHISSDQSWLFTNFGCSNHEYLLPPLVEKEEVPGFPGVKAGALCFKKILAHGFGEPLAKVLDDINKGLLTEFGPQCIVCFSMYAHKFLDCSTLRTVPICRPPFCQKLNSFITEIASRGCIFTEAFFGSDGNMNQIAQGLKVNYSPEVSLENYLEIIDGKTTRAIRKIMNHILEDPMAARYKQRLYSKIYELNKEVDEISQRRLTRMGISTTDIVSYYLKKLIPVETARKGIDWLANVSLSLQAKLLGKDWAVLQLYTTRKRLKRKQAKQ